MNALNQWAGSTVSSKLRPWGGSKKTRLPLCSPELKDGRSGRAPCRSPGKLKVSARRVLGPQCGEGSGATERAALRHLPQATRVARVPKRAHLKPAAPGFPAALRGCPEPSLASAQPRPAAAAPLPPKPAPRCDSPAPAPGKVWWRVGRGGQAAGCAAGAAAGAPGSARGGGAPEEEPLRGAHPRAAGKAGTRAPRACSAPAPGSMRPGPPPRREGARGARLSLGHPLPARAPGLELLPLGTRARALRGGLLLGFGRRGGRRVRTLVRQLHPHPRTCGHTKRQTEINQDKEAQMEIEMKRCLAESITDRLKKTNSDTCAPHSC